MNSGLYAACAGLRARTQALELAANNLANLNTNGYKGQVASFRSQLATASGALRSAVNQAVNNFGVLGSTRVDMAQGSLEHTGSDLDFAIQGEGWFAVQTGSGRLRNFHVDRSGHLVTSEGNVVAGAEGAITIPPGKLSVSHDGTISVDGALAGQLQVVTFAPGTALTPAGSSYFAAPAGSERVGTGQIVQGTLEGSKLNAVMAAVGLVELQRRADFLQQALTAFHANFNRIAAQDLSRL
ncbi:MAG: flagellar hook basal-body protein [Acidobacteriota bacterium]|nr:flagellar hook basal-body protein [Acidobacteriota bacterium]